MKLQIQKIKNEQGESLENQQEIREKAIRVFKEQFKENNFSKNYSMIDIIPTLVSEEEA